MNKNLRQNRSGLIAIFVAALFWTAPILAAASGIDNPAANIKIGLGKLLDCDWQGSDGLAVCPVKSIKGVVNLSRDPTGKTIETVEMNALVAGHPKPRPGEEKLSRETVERMVAYLLPGWKKEHVWLTDALKAATHVRGRKVTKIGNTTVLVQWLQPADIADTFATVVITKKPTIDDWKWGDEIEGQ